MVIDMTQLEILRLAATMIYIKIDKEEAIAKEVLETCGHEDEIAKLRIRRYEAQAKELGQMILSEERKEA